MQTVLPNIQLLPSLSHVQSDGSEIGGVDPENYSSEVRGSSLFMYTAGAKTPGYPAWMWYPAEPLPLQQSASKLALDIEFILGGNIEAVNAIETDIIIIAPNTTGVMQKLNRSAQFVQGSGFQVAKEDGTWESIGVNPGPLKAYSTYRFVYMHELSMSANSISPSTSSTSSVCCNGVKSLVPAALQQVPSQKTDWSPAGVYVQIQQSSLPSAEAWTLKIKKLKVTQS